jgi:hypothetical protein
MWPIITDSKNPNFEKVGGHSFNTVSPDRTFDYGAACKSCHGDVTDFNLQAKADYDGNGKVEATRTKSGPARHTVEGAGSGASEGITGNPYATLPCHKVRTPRSGTPGSTSARFMV